MRAELKSPIIPELIGQFANRRSVNMADLRDFYREHTTQFNDQAFRRFMYALEKQRVIRPVARGLYVFQKETSQSQDRKKFIPAPSPEIIKLNTDIKDSFPYLQYAIWETRILHDFMTHQPGQNQIIVDVERNAVESVFNALTPIYPNQVWLNPDQNMLERYIVNSPRSIIVSNLISQSPLINVDTVPYPSIEKILVDIFVDQDTFFMLQGQELVNIFENIFTSYWVNEKTLLRYAQRRQPVDKIKKFINDQTSIELVQNEVSRK